MEDSQSALVKFIAISKDYPKCYNYSMNSPPKEIDNETVIFSYGSLLNHRQLRELLKHRGDFNIFETTDLDEAVKLTKANPNDIIILKNVVLENVRVSIVTETMLRRWFQKHGGDLQKLIAAGVTTFEIPQAVFLYARPAKMNEKSRSLNGGLICNLTKDEVLMLDSYEFEPVLKRTRTPKLVIQNQIFTPQHITFYAGTESAKDITPAEKIGRAHV